MLCRNCGFRPCRFGDHDDEARTIWLSCETLVCSSTRAWESARLRRRERQTIDSYAAVHRGRRSRSVTTDFVERIFGDRAPSLPGDLSPSLLDCPGPFPEYYAPSTRRDVVPKIVRHCCAATSCACSPGARLWQSESSTESDLEHWSDY